MIATDFGDAARAHRAARAPALRNIGDGLDLKAPHQETSHESLPEDRIL